MTWITRERVKVDRVACPWLLRKVVDPEPERLCQAMVAQGKPDDTFK